MLKGYIRKQDFDTRIEGIYLFDKKNHLIPLTVVLDTGFTDFLCLPEKFKDDCNLIPLGSAFTELGDGEIKEEMTYLVKILVDNEDVTVETSFTKANEVLIGNKLLADKIVTINFKELSIKIED